MREEEKNKPQHSLYGRGCKGRGYFVLTGTRTNTWNCSKNAKQMEKADTHTHTIEIEMKHTKN